MIGIETYVSRHSGYSNRLKLKDKGELLYV